MSASTENGNGKGTVTPPVGFRPTNGRPNGAPAPISGLINVQPPRREDLQPAYAQILQGESEDAGTHGWYGSMSKLLAPGSGQASQAHDM